MNERKTIYNTTINAIFPMECLYQILTPSIFKMIAESNILF